MVFNLRSVDLNLLPVFEAAYEERSLSRAAQRLAMTQPAVSHALARLRTTFKDELFIRQSRGVVPTVMADAIHLKLRGALGAVRDAVTDARGFDPATSHRRFSVTIPHPLGPLLALAVLERLRKVAPHFNVEFSTRSLPVDLERGLQDGRVHAAIDWLPPRDDELRSRVLFEDRLMAMARAGHPLLRQRVTRTALQSASFVMLHMRVTGEHPLAAIRELRDLRSRTVLRVSELLEVLLVVSHSDLVGIMPQSLRGIAKDNFGVHAIDLAQKVARVPTHLIWHTRQHDDPAHRFLREQLTEVTAEVTRF